MQHRTRVTWLGLAMASAGLLASCSDSSGPRGPGTLEATLVSPNGPEGAVVLELVGGGIDSVTETSHLTYVQQDGATIRLVVVLEDPGVIEFELAVRDVSDPPQTTVVQVADGDNELRGSVAGYRVDLVPVVEPSTSRRGPR